MEPIIVVGLGNPGNEYEDTRHNLGFMVVDGIAGRLKKEFRAGKGDYVYASGAFAGRNLVLVKPVTYMNNNGTAVVDIRTRLNGSNGNLLVVVDDLALPLGRIRLREKGSDGGHNGLYSIIYHLNSDEFPRLRCGIRKEDMPPGNVMRSFVLSPFDEDERKIVEEMVRKAGDAALEFAAAGIARSMSRFNT